MPLYLLVKSCISNLSGYPVKILYSPLKNTGPNKSGPANGNRGWAFCARTPDRAFLLLYFEAGCPPASVRGLLANGTYVARWFNPRTGQWIDAGEWTANANSYLSLPPFPSGEDWALKLISR